ncbi:NAD(P)-binding domain-containing protein [Gordonia sp. HY002]|uniref:flavin-containing monooxygenase n=3 Tax=Gordonia zhenghanii TaxID=2911516 RepID=UPI001F3CF7E6|nr:NAD(P)/FAD-dependent oxidoreductase [Gordonia zhenghanii]MCF8571142.1 NAD(P)-binding domain-containing protein [Gordonia zhenghanii]
MTELLEHSDALDDEAVASKWAARFSEAVRAGGGAAELFVEDAWWRDLLAFTGDLHSRQGVAALDAQLVGARSALRGSVQVAAPPDFAAVLPGDDGAVTAFLAFETVDGRGQGLVRLASSDGVWRAVSLFTTPEELRDLPFAAGAARPDGNSVDGRTWHARRAAERDLGDGEPDVLIVGAGHSGLGLAAYLRAMGLRPLLVDQNQRVGDNWRHRYDSLVLHDPVHYDEMPFFPYPQTWPVFAPKEKMGDWLELYASAMELDVWCSTTVDDAERVGDRWRVTLRSGASEGGARRTVSPAHVVLATGVSGTVPQTPQVPGEFDGPVVHSSGYRGGGFGGKHVVVVGTGNSGHDVAQDLVEHGDRVTMIQRGPTYVVSAGAVGAVMMGASYSDSSPPTSISDYLGASSPHLSAATTAGLQAATAAMAEYDAELHRGLSAAGFALSHGDDGTGSMRLFLGRGGGYYIDVGCSRYIVDGAISVRSGVSLDGYDGRDVLLSDGSRVAADAVVLATGFGGMEKTARAIFGDELAESCGQVWGLDDEGEVCGVWRRTAQPGFWFAGGNLGFARMYNRYLALTIGQDHLAKKKSEREMA